MTAPVASNLFGEPDPAPAQPSSGLFADIVFDRPVDHAFTSAVPIGLAETVRVGKRVEAPFGKGGKNTPGFCVRVTGRAPDRTDIKSITRVIDDDALVDNAFKYSRPGTPVVVRVGRDDTGRWVEVEDRGAGIGADERGELFRPFFRSESARRQGVSGSGLGLAVAARVATAHGGSITVESEVGKGSRFRVWLPGPPN